MREKMRRLPIFLASVLSLLMFAGQALAAYTTGSEAVSGDRTSGPFGWHYQYTRSFDGKQIKKDIEIKFQFDAKVTLDAAGKTNFINQAVANIASVWNNKFTVKDNATGTLIPCVVNITTAGPFDQTVTVFQNVNDTPQKNVDMTNWTVGDSANVQGHEVGHMMGLFDEYVGGAQDTPPIASPDGLMGLGGAQGATPVMYPRYYQQFLDYMKKLNTGNFSLVAVPLPAAWASGGVILLLLVVRKATARRAAA